MLGYRFSSQGAELHIEHPRIERVVIEVEPFAMVVRGPRSVAATLAADGSEEDPPARFGLTELHGAVQCIRERIETRGWRAPVLPRTVLLGHLLAERERGLAHANPAVHAVERAVLRVARRLPRLAGEPALYAEPFVVKDVVNYRAAACALAHLESRLYRPWARRGGLAAGADPLATDDLVGAMREWRSLFSPSGEAYRSLNRTLMNLPPSVPAELLYGLAGYRLSGPMTEPLALTALLLHLSDAHAGRNLENAATQRRILERTRDREIAPAVEKIANRTERRLRPERLADLAFVVRYLADDPEPFQGRLEGWVQRAIRWHERFAPPRPDAAPARAGRAAAAAPRRDRAPARLPEPKPASPHERPTVRPPIPLPSIPGVEFLSTVARIVAEGRRMNNCIASYAESAVAGRCYLFHVTHDGEEASVEIDPGGRVRQAEGPANTENRASRWAAGQLAAWANGLRPPDPAWLTPRSEANARVAAAPPPRDPAASARRAGRTPRWSRRVAHDPRQLELWPKSRRASL